MPSRFLYLR